MGSILDFSRLHASLQYCSMPQNNNNGGNHATFDCAGDVNSAMWCATVSHLHLQFTRFFSGFFELLIQILKMLLC